MRKAFSTEEFISISNERHSHKYDYSKVNYVNKRSRILIICSIHGEFIQLAGDHLRGSNCPKCAREDINKKISLTIDIFIKKAKQIHKDLYNYSKSVYIASAAPLEIICQNHGSFWQAPHEHLRGSGCAKCAFMRIHNKNRYSLNEFIERANEVHKHKYSYDKTNYENISTPIEIICKKHGSFYQYPHNHLNGCECPKCSRIHSNAELAWLDLLGVPDKFRGKTIKVNGKKFNLDAIDKDNKIIWEFNGDFWHGNPIVFNPNDFNSVVKKTFGELHKNTILKQELLEKAGYKVISIWESDFNA